MNDDQAIADQLITRLNNLVNEALIVRFEPWAGQDAMVPIDPDLGLPHVHAELLRARGRADRMDQIMVDVTKLRGAVRRRREAAKFEAERAYNEATRNNQTRRTVEFTTGRERHADASIDSFNERRAEYEANRLQSVADESYELVRGFTFQLSAIRNEARGFLNSLSFESSLER